jgi:hypothetical protein
MPLLALLLAAAAPPELNDPKTTEGWIWQQAQAGEVADLVDKCRIPPLDVHDDPRWQATCRRVDPVLLRALLTQPDLADHAPHGVQIHGARIDGSLDLEDAHVRAVEVDLEDSWLARDVDLSDARLEGFLSLDGTLIDGKLTGARVWLGSSLSMDDTVFGGPVDLRDAHVGGELTMKGATFRSSVILHGAHVDGQMDMQSANVADQQPFDAERLHVGRDLFARSVTFGGDAIFILLNVGSVDLRDSHVRRLDLAGAIIDADLVVGGKFPDGSEGWLRWDACDSPAPCLILRNTRVGNLQDDERAWPPRITLEGFTYTHLGGFGGEQRQDMRNRPIDWWRDWLKRDPIYSAQPYAQLASVLAAAGNRDGAADIRFSSRDRGRSELLRGCVWLQKAGLVDEPDVRRPCKWGPWLGLSAQQLFVGYGIGDYSFRAVGWALALALIGTVILWFAPGVRGVRSTQRGPRAPWQKSPWWCFGASLHQVLPLISLSQEFNEFFDDPKRERLRTWQHVAFAVLTLCGWALAGFVAAAFTGLIQS